MLQKEPEDSVEMALDALDTIQMSGWQLYSTFPNLHHDCRGIINSFKIGRLEFESALLTLLNTHYLDMPVEKMIYLTSTASKAQEEYVVRTCESTSEMHILEESTLPPQKGMWIFPSLLNQRDLIFKW
ncbi:MAG: hypothetical protein JKY54_00320 [Flavobacteriales bacterium]|nr:hypothetical protein [Flavobacteriales bacterium]